MKNKLFKIIPIIGLLFTIVSCQSPDIIVDSSNQEETTTTLIEPTESSTSTTLIEPSSESTIEINKTITQTIIPVTLPTEESTIEPTTTTIIPTESTTSTIETTTTEEVGKYTLSEIKVLGEALAEGQTGKKVSFEAMYVKKITDNNDHLFLFVDDTDYLCMRHLGKLTDYLNNRYTFCKYAVSGTVTKINGNVEVLYETLENITSVAETFDFSNLSTKVDTIADVYTEVAKVSLNNKYNGIGSIVTFSGCVIATDRDDANQKAVLYDNNNLITVINEKKICDGYSDIMNQFEVTGIISILKGQPAILLLNLKQEEKTINIDYSNAQAVTPSYFSKWYHVSDKIKDPAYSDFSKLYKITGYVNKDESRTSSMYFGLTDAKDGKLADDGIKTSIQGVYMMNYQNQKYENTYNEAICDAYVNSTNVEVYASLYQFDTQNHGWKVFIIDQTLKAIE